MIEGIFVEGLIYGIIALGVFITYRVLDFPDLSVDGTFPLGAAVMVQSIIAGIPLPVAFLLAFISGAAAGATTALIHNKLNVPSLLASILTMTMLYSINMRIMKAPFISLNKVPTLLSKFASLTKSFLPDRALAYFVLFLIIITITIIVLTRFFHTDMGLCLGALGDNEQMIINQGMNPEHLKIIGLALSNGLVAIAGGFVAQYQKFADINMGIGIVVIGLASVMIGELVIKSNRISMLLVRVVIGATIYRGILFLSRPLLIYPTDHKLFTGLLIIIILLITKFNKKEVAK